MYPIWNVFLSLYVTGKIPSEKVQELTQTTTSVSDYHHDPIQHPNITSMFKLLLSGLKLQPDGQDLHLEKQIRNTGGKERTFLTKSFSPW